LLFDDDEEGKHKNEKPEDWKKEKWYPMIVSYGARFLTGLCTRGCHWVPCMFA
jgi:hypothetical protein